MPESVAPLWAVPLLPLALLLLAFAAAVMDAAAAAMTAGRGVGADVFAVPVREAARLLAKQRATTRMPDATSWRIGGGTIVVVAVLASVVLPLAPGVVVTDLAIGLVWWTALMALLWVGVYLAGWGGNAPYDLVAGYRFIAQALAYEMPLAITIVGVAVAAESLAVGEVVAAQQGTLWYVVLMPAGFAVYLLCAAAIAFWGPFATPTAPDSAGGVAANLAGVDRLLLLAGRYLVLASAAAFAVPLFLGGGAGPLLPNSLWTVVKTLGVLALLVVAKWRLPQVRMDWFEEFAWVVLIPVTLVQLGVVCLIVLLTRG